VHIRPRSLLPIVLAFLGSPVTHLTGQVITESLLPAGSSAVQAIDRRFDPYSSKNSGASGSPAAGKIAFVSSRDGNPEIYTINTDGTDLTRLTNDPGIDEEPVWSPDGQRIAFVSERSGNSELYVMNADGSNVVRRTFSACCTQTPSWSPDGTKIVYSTLSNGSANLWVVSPNADGPGPTLLFEEPGVDAQPAWSPDGTRLALVSDSNAYDFVWDIFLINADGSGFTGLTGDIFDHVDYLGPSWSPNGARIAHVVSERTGINTYITTLAVMNADGTGETRLISACSECGSGISWGKLARSSWSPDGQVIAFTSATTDALNVSWVAADGSASGLIVSNGWNPSWRPTRAPAIDSRILPVVGSTAGVGGSFFRTSVQLHNPTSSVISGRIVFHPSGLSGSSSDLAMPYTLSTGQTQSIADFLPAMGRSGLGSADIEATSGSIPAATVRVFNDAGAAGSTGFTEEPMRAEEALRVGSSGVLLLPADLTRFRFNLGVRTLEAGASATLTVRDAVGAVVTTVSRSFTATYHEQQSAAGFLGVSSVPPGGSITVAPTSGSAIFYGATVDNTTGDPSLQIARPGP
jgi:Tol biopolymer transport system component